MSLSSKILLTCKHATLLMTKEQEKAISPLEKFRMHLHMLFCKFCTLFYRQSNLLHDAVKKINRSEPDLIHFDEQKRSELENLLRRF